MSKPANRQASVHSEEVDVLNRRRPRGAESDPRMGRRLVLLAAGTDQGTWVAPIGGLIAGEGFSSSDAPPAHVTTSMSMMPRTTVPLPGSLSIASRPPIASRRSAMP
jgi:hypothetical protein